MKKVLAAIYRRALSAIKNRAYECRSRYQIGRGAVMWTLFMIFGMILCTLYTINGLNGLVLLLSDLVIPTRAGKAFLAVPGGDRGPAGRTAVDRTAQPGW